MDDITIVKKRLECLSEVTSHSISSIPKVYDLRSMEEGINRCKPSVNFNEAVSLLKCEKLRPSDIIIGSNIICNDIIPKMKSYDIEGKSSLSFIQNDELRSDINSIIQTIKSINPKTVDELINKNDLLTAIYNGDSIENLLPNDDLLNKLITNSGLVSYECALSLSHKSYNITVDRNKIEKNKSYIESSHMIYESMSKYRCSDRVINNYRKLSNRYNVDSIIQEYGNTITEDQTDAMYKFCKLVDTYNIPFMVKYTMCLENGLYLLYKNCIPYTLDNIAESVTDYFIITENNNQSENLETITKILSTNPFFKDCNYSKQFILKENIRQYKNELISIKEELNVPDFVDSDVALESMIDYKINSLFSKYKDAYLTENSEESDDANKKISKLQKIKNMISKANKDGKEEAEEVKKDDKDIDELIDNYKKEEKKDTPALQRLINKLFAKSPESVLKSTPNMLGFVRQLVLLTTIANPFGLILNIVNFALSLSLDRKQAEKMLNYFKKERDIAEEKYDNEDDKETRDRLYQYMKKLDDAIEKLENHQEDLKSNVDDEDWKPQDILNDMAQVILCCEAAETINNFDPSIISNAIKNHYDIIPHEFIEAVTEASLICNNIIPRSMILEALESTYSNICKTDINVTDPNYLEHLSLYNCLSENITKIKKCDIDCDRDDICYIELAEVLKCIELNLSPQNYLHEGMSAKNTFKIAAIDIKKKIVNLSDKTKQFTNNVNAAANRLRTSIEAGVTNSNREAVIRGSIIPKFSSLLKMIIASIAVIGTSAAIPAIGVSVGIGVVAIGWFASMASKKIATEKERTLIVDEIDTEIEIVQKKMAIVEREEDFDKLRELMKLEKKLKREAQRIRMNARAANRAIPEINKD